MPTDDASFEKETGTDNNEAGDAAETREEMDFSKEFEILTKLDDDWRDHMSQVGGAQPYTNEDAEKRQHFFDSLVTEASLQEHLMRQAELADIDGPMLNAMRHLVGSLDDHGFLTQTPADIALQTNLPLEIVQSAVKLLKRSSRPAIGSQNLQECLLAQLTAKGRGESLAARIVRDHFRPVTPAVASTDIARKLGDAHGRRAIGHRDIGVLDPAPGRRFAGTANRVVSADVTVEKDGANGKSSQHRLHPAPAHLEYLQGSSSPRAPLSKSERDYLREQHALRQVSHQFHPAAPATIERITARNHQGTGEFFEHGVSKLKPLTMTQDCRGRRRARDHRQPRDSQ